jgi:two-component system KDP operon response regulator KdpE
MKEQTGRILIIDDDDQSALALASSLKAAKFEVTVASGSRQAMKLIERDPPDVIVMERFLESENTLETCSRMRQILPSTLLMLSKNGRENTVIESLDAGADDFLRKPVVPGEFLARIRALLRRSGSHGPVQPALRVGQLALDPGKRRVTVEETEVRLTRTEFDILGCLMQNDGQTVGYQKLLQFVWGSTPHEGVRALRVHVAHLRKKIESDPSRPKYILTEPGVGYRFDSQTTETQTAAAG